MKNILFISLCALLLVLCVRGQNSTIPIPNPCYHAVATGSSWAADDSTPRYVALSCGLLKSNVAATASLLTLTAGADGTCPCSNYAHSCAQAYSSQVTGHGYYECSMKPSGVPGTVTTCQVVSYEGGYEDVHIKFIGNDTSRVSIGYQIGSVLYQAGPVTLKFDAKSDYNSYGFEWTSGYIKWFVNGKEESSEQGSRPIPTKPNYFTLSYVIEQAGVTTYDSGIYTEGSVDRTYTSLTSSSVSFNNITYIPQTSESCDGTGVNPSGSSWQGYDPTACTMGASLSIYHDTLASGWTTTDSSVFNPAASDQARSGSSISWDVKPSAVLNLFYSGTISQTDYYGFEFWVNGGSQSGQQVTVRLVLPGNTYSTAVNIADVMVPGIQTYSWSRALFPFNRFGLTSDIPILGFSFGVITTDFAGVIFIDDIRLVQQYPICANRTSFIFDESLSSDYLDASWPVGTYTFGSTDYAYDGSKSIKWESYNNDGLQVHSKVPIDTTLWQGIQMYIYAGQAKSLDITICLTSGDANTPLGVMSLLRYFGGSLPPAVDGNWVKVTIPFYEFGVYAGTPINGFRLQGQYNAYQGFFYIDDVALVRTVAQDDSGGKTSTSSSSRLAASSLLVFVSLILYALF